MDPTNFRNGMNLLALLPTAGGGDETQITIRWEGYKRLFAEDDGVLFEQACVRGVQTAWKWFPSPMEIREQMAAITKAVEQERERLTYEDRMQLTLDKLAAERRLFEARAAKAFRGVEIGEPPRLEGLNERDAATAVVNFAEELLRKSKRIPPEQPA